MTSHSGPNIITDGLVLCLDAANSKSFKGEPTTNLLAQPLSFQTGYTTESWTTGEIQDNAVLAPDGTMTATRIKRVSGYFYKRNEVSPTFTISPGETITFSCWVKKLDSTNQTGRGLYIWCYNGSGSGNRTAATQEIYLDQWVRQSVTYTALAGETSFAFGFVGSGGNHLQGEVAIWHPQLEKKSYATPFVNGTRGSTVVTGGGWADLSNNSNNGELLNGLTYNSSNSGSIVFDGTDDRITIPTISLGNGNLPWTATAWIKTTTNASALGAGSVLSNSNGGPVNSMMGVNDGKIVYWTYYSGAWQKKLGIGKTVNDGQWHYLAWVNYSNSTMDMYVDGILDSNVGNSTSGNNNPINIIGSSWAAAFPGNIGNVSIYNVALSANQINNNFNALRGRYGI